MQHKHDSPPMRSQPFLLLRFFELRPACLQTSFCPASIARIEQPVIVAQCMPLNPPTAIQQLITPKLLPPHRRQSRQRSPRQRFFRRRHRMLPVKTGRPPPAHHQHANRHPLPHKIYPKNCLTSSATKLYPSRGPRVSLKPPSAAFPSPFPPISRSLPAAPRATSAPPPSSPPIAPTTPPSASSAPKPRRARATPHPAPRQ